MDNMDDPNEKLSSVSSNEPGAEDNCTGDASTKEKHIPPRPREIFFTEDQRGRYEELVSSPVEFVDCFSIQRKRLLVWLWPYIGRQRLYCEESGRFERFLVSAEKILALRKQQRQKKKKLSEDTYKQIIDIAADYILNHQGSVYVVKVDVKYFIGQILWVFYEKYPACCSNRTKAKDPLEHAVEGISSFSDSKLATVTAEIGALLPNMKPSKSDFSTWQDGKLHGLCTKIIKSIKSEDNKKGIEESGYTINIRIGLASHVTSQEEGRMLHDALQLSRDIHGKYHSITWSLTAKLGNFFLDRAADGTSQYYLSKFNGDKVKGVQELYEDFLNGALQEANDNTELLRERVAPVLVQFYKEHGEDNKARALLWRFTHDRTQQLYAEFFVPFVGPTNSGPILASIHSVEEFGLFSNFNYSSLETVIFKIDKILPKSVELSDQEKMLKWHPMVEQLPVGPMSKRTPMNWIPGLPGGYEVQIGHESKGLIVLNLPFITYKHFKRSETYRFGCTYEVYRKGSVNHPVLTNWKKENEENNNGFIPNFALGCHEFFTYFPHEPVDAFVLVDSATGSIEKHLYNKESGKLVVPDEGSPWKSIEKPELLPILSIPGSDTTQGFFNNTPGDMAILDHSRIANGFNLVSAEWIDWRRFVLHTCPAERQPKLTASDGSYIPVLGYIYGTWTDFNITKRWTGLQVYVVQARFEISTIKTPDIEELSSSYHFVLNPDDLCKMRESDVALQDARATCTFLNPSMVRLMILKHLEPQMIYCFGSTPDDDFEGVKTVSCPETDSGLLTELARRDKWDKEYAYLYWNTDMWKTRLEKMKEQATAEMTKRKEWDEQYVKGAKQWMSGWK